SAARPAARGAADTARAVAALLERADGFGPWRPGGGPWTARLQLAAYDHEETGLLGSAPHSARLSGPLRAMMSLEMLGFTDRRPRGPRPPPPPAGPAPPARGS